MSPSIWAYVLITHNSPRLWMTQIDALIPMIHHIEIVHLHICKWKREDKITTNFDYDLKFLSNIKWKFLFQISDLRISAPKIASSMSKNRVYALKMKLPSTKPKVYLLLNISPIDVNARFNSELRFSTASFFAKSSRNLSAIFKQKKCKRNRGILQSMTIHNVHNWNWVRSEGFVSAQWRE